MSIADHYNEMTNAEAIKALAREGITWNPKKG